MNVRLIKDLRVALSNAIANFKAYEVPAVCKRLGMREGEESEAFSSKYKYASSRASELNNDDLLKASRQLLEEEPDLFYLNEAVEKLNDANSKTITRLTRKKLLSLFGRFPLSQEMSEFDALSMIWPLERMPFPESSHATDMAEYLKRHMVFHDDISTREALEELGFLECSQSQVFKVLEIAVNPESRNTESQKIMVGWINEIIGRDDYELSVKEMISGEPLYSVQKVQAGVPLDSTTSEFLREFDVDTIHERWEKALERRASDPRGAITLARTLTEDVCKWILDKEGATYTEDDDITALYRKLSKSLKLAPDDHTEQVFKQILGSCQSIVTSISGIRNKLGDAHSQGPKRARPAPRHAELVVNLAGTMATFLIATWKSKQESSAPTE